MTRRPALAPDVLRARRRTRAVQLALGGLVLAFGLIFALVLSAAPVDRNSSMTDETSIAAAREALAARYAAGVAHRQHLCGILEAIAETGRRGTGGVKAGLGEIIGRIDEFGRAMDRSWAAESQALAVIAAALRDIRRRA